MNTRLRVGVTKPIIHTLQVVAMGGVELVSPSGMVETARLQAKQDLV